MAVSPGAELITDRELVEQVRRGSSEALALLYARHGRELYAMAYRISGTTADAEDVLHDLFLGLPELLQRYHEQGQLRAWLRQVTARLTLIRLRRTKRRREVDLRELVHGEELRREPETAVDLGSALDSLPRQLRTVFILKQVEGFSHAEIATMLGISAGASRVRYVRAVRRLRAILEPGS